MLLGHRQVITTRHNRSVTVPRKELGRAMLTHIEAHRMPSLWIGNPTTTQVLSLQKGAVGWHLASSLEVGDILLAPVGRDPGDGSALPHPGPADGTPGRTFPPDWGALAQDQMFQQGYLLARLHPGGISRAQGFIPFDDVACLTAGLDGLDLKYYTIANRKLTGLGLGAQAASRLLDRILLEPNAYTCLPFVMGVLSGARRGTSQRGSDTWRALSTFIVEWTGREVIDLVGSLFMRAGLTCCIKPNILAVGAADLYHSKGWIGTMPPSLADGTGRAGSCAPPCLKVNTTGLQTATQLQEALCQLWDSDPATEKAQGYNRVSSSKIAEQFGKDSPLLQYLWPTITSITVEANQAVEADSSSVLEVQTYLACEG